MPDVSLVPVHRSAELDLFAFGPVHVSVYRATPTVELLRVDQRHHEALARRVGRTRVLTFADYGLALPDEGARSLSSSLVRDNARFVERCAVVFEGSGFWASAARSVVTTVFLIARQPYPSKVHATTRDAAADVCAGLGYDPDALATALDTHRRQAATSGSSRRVAAA